MCSGFCCAAMQQKSTLLGSRSRLDAASSVVRVKLQVHAVTPIAEAPALDHRCETGGKPMAARSGCATASCRRLRLGRPA
ncbi:hypothetical protein BQ8482_350217 [Mesorhizobium delmotii]|uniref:Uncharacterized protein n=1 Tax=Mesorhizobium delmotii TaxID=1631247 RepID=A0A2P9AQZ2_9HYPH|nr:hypothetical protein BQ8482_350217 [Mesorhizobium delmotii]